MFIKRFLCLNGFKSEDEYLQFVTKNAVKHRFFVLKSLHHEISHFCLLLLCIYIYTHVYLYLLWLKGWMDEKNISPKNKKKRKKREYLVVIDIGTDTNRVDMYVQ